MNIKNITVGVCALVAVAFGVNYAIQPHSYEDCVLKAMSKTDSDRAAFFAKQACQIKFASKSDVQIAGKPRIISEEEFMGKAVNQ